MEENYYFNKEDFRNEKVNFLGNKQKRHQFKENIEKYFSLPDQIISKFTNNYIKDELMPSQILKKSKIEIINSNLKENKHQYPYSPEKEKEISNLKEEIDEILNELEIFKRNHRKNKLIHLMSKIAEHIDDRDIEIDDITDFYLFGDSLENIENVYLDKQKNENLQKTKKFVDYTNKLLEDDDNDFSIRNNKS